MDGRVREGASITQALKEYGEKNSMSWLTARWKYYQVRNQDGAPSGDEAQPVPVVKVAMIRPEVSAEPQSRGDDFLGYLQDLVRATEESGQDIVPFIKGFSRMAVLSKESMRLREDVGAIRDRLKAIEAALSTHCRHLGDWLGRTQVERVSCLKEFSDLMARDLAALEEARERLANS